MRLADHPGLEMSLQVERHVHLIAQHLAGGDPGPARDHLAHEGCVDHDGYERRFALQCLEFPGQLRELGAEGGAVAARALFRGRLEPLPRGPHLGDEVALPLPALLQGGEPAFGLDPPLRELREPLGVIRARRALPFEHARLHGDVVELPRRLLEGRGDRVLAEREPRARRIEHAHGLVGQLTIREVAVGQAHRRFRPGIENAHLVVLLEDRDDAAHHHETGRLGRLLYLHELEAAGEGRVLLEILLVL
jgi:hypothetical protein